MLMVMKILQGQCRLTWKEIHQIEFLMDILSFEFHTFEEHPNNVIDVSHTERRVMLFYLDFHSV